jgi:uncharacterized protein (UPF0332 family)
MNSNEFVSFAGKLAAQNSIGAAGYRSAISRAYYGAFHSAREFLDRHFHWQWHADNDHLWVQRHFQNCVSRDVVKIGYFLVDLHESRKCADYDLADLEAEMQITAMNCVARASDVCSKLAALENPTTLSQIQVEMEDYRRRVNLH